MTVDREGFGEGELRALAPTVTVRRVADFAGLARRRRLRRGARNRHIAVGVGLVGALAALALVAVVVSGPSTGSRVEVGARPKQPAATSPPAARGRLPVVRPAVKVGSVPGANPTAMACPAVGTCYLTGEFGGTIYTPAGEVSRGMLVTHDGGKTWVSNGPDVGTNLTCVNAEVCAGSAGSTNIFSETVDGGRHWSTYLMPGRQGNSLSCVTAARCVSVETQTGRVDITTDGGQTWTTRTLPKGFTDFRPYGLQCFADGHCVTVGVAMRHTVVLGPTVSLYSTDGGRRWHQGTIPKGFVDPGANVSCSGPWDCMAIGSAGKDLAIVTRDGGRTWRAVANPGGALSREGFQWVSCVSGATCWAVTAEVEGASLGIVETTDFGRSWRLLGVGPTVGIVGTIACATTTACYATATRIQPTSPPPSSTGGAGGRTQFLSW